MIPDPIRIDELRCEMKLNGVPVKSVGIRGASDFHEDLEIVVIEPALGSFARTAETEAETTVHLATPTRNTLLPSENLARA